MSENPVNNSTDPVRAWREWRQAEAEYNRASQKLHDWSPEASAAYDAARRRKDDAWKLVCRLMDAAALGVRNG